MRVAGEVREWGMNMGQGQGRARVKDSGAWGMRTREIAPVAHSAGDRKRPGPGLRKREGAVEVRLHGALPATHLPLSCTNVTRDHSMAPQGHVLYIRS